MSITKTRLTHGLTLRYAGLHGVISVRNHIGTASDADDIVKAFVELDAFSHEWFGEVLRIVLVAEVFCSKDIRDELEKYLEKPSLSPQQSNNHHLRHAMYTIISRRYQ